MKPYRIRAVILRHAYEVYHNANHITYMVYWPVVNIVVWGFFTLYLRHGDRLQPGVISCLLGAVILWGLFNAFQRDMAVGFLEELWSRNLVSLFGSPLSVSEYVTGLIIVTLGQGDDRLDRRVPDRLFLLPLQHLSDAAGIDSVHTEPGSVRAYDGHRNHRLDLPLHHEVPGYGMELRRYTDAAIVRILPVELIAELPASDGLDTPDYSFIRRNAGGYRKGSFSILDFKWGLGLNMIYLHLCRRFLQIDVRVGAIARAVGENGITTGIRLHAPGREQMRR